MWVTAVILEVRGRHIQKFCLLGWWWVAMLQLQRNIISFQRFCKRCEDDHSYFVKEKKKHRKIALAWMKQVGSNFSFSSCCVVFP